MAVGGYAEQQSREGVERDGAVSEHPAILLSQLSLRIFPLPSLSLSLTPFFPRTTPSFSLAIPAASQGRSGTGMTLERGITGVIGPVGGGGRRRGPTREVVRASYRVGAFWSPAVSCHGLRFRRIFPLAMDILPSAPVASLSLACSRTLSLALALSLSLALLTGTLGQHPRYTATRSGVAALASSPAVSARRRYSFLPACLPTCLPTLALSHSHPLLFRLAPTLTCSPRRLPSCLRSLSP